MKIAFVISIKIWGGVKTWMLEFGKALQLRGHEIVYFSNDNRLTEEVSQNGCQAYTVKFGADYNPVAVRFFYKKFKEHKIDVTCMNIQKEIRTAGIAARLLKIPVVQRIGLPTDINFKLDQRFAQRYLVDEILVTCLWMKTETAKRFHFTPAEKYTVVYNSKPAVCRPRKSKHDPVRFVITSRPAEGKGHESLVEAFHEVFKQGITNFTCDIYGEGIRGKKLKEQIDGHGLDKNIFLKGFSRNLSELLKQYDFGLLTSKSEGLPNTVIEYMSAALPCITTRAGALPEVIEHEKNGFLYTYNDVSALSVYLKRCIEMDNVTYEGFSRESHHTIAEKFNLDSNVKALEEYFEKVIKKYRR
ncbi:glycosyltransferase [bacterium]|nr:glycosyltransferase [bacterium]